MGPGSGTEIKKRAHSRGRQTLVVSAGPRKDKDIPIKIQGFSAYTTKGPATKVDGKAWLKHTIVRQKDIQPTIPVKRAEKAVPEQKTFKFRQ